MKIIILAILWIISLGFTYGLLNWVYRRKIQKVNAVLDNIEKLERETLRYREETLKRYRQKAKALELLERAQGFALGLRNGEDADLWFIAITKWLEDYAKLKK